MSVTAPIFHYGRTRPDALALVEGERTITYFELAALIARTATHLGALGLGSGDRIGLCLRDGAAYVISLLAASRIGAVAVPLDWRASASENARFSNRLQLKRMLAEPDARLTADVPAVVLDSSWHRTVALADPSNASPADWNAPFLISASSGSTGSPKFTQMTHAQYYFAIVAHWELMGLAGHYRFLCTLPFYYGHGRNSCMTHLLRGDCIVLYPNLFAPLEYVDVVNHQRITAAAVVPSMVRQLLAASQGRPLLPDLAMFVCAGAPLQPEEKREAACRLTPQFHDKYGTAEASAISILRPSDLADRPDSVGQPHSLAEIEVVDESHRSLPSGAFGRLRFRGPSMGSPLPESAAEETFRDGWFYPGEFARLDEAGYIFLQGRTSDVIMRGGAKIFPSEIEAALREHPAIAEAVVMGSRATDREEEVLAFIVPRREIALGEIIAHCRAQVSAHKVPRHFRFVSELPKNTAGKVDKLALAKLLGRDGTE